MPGLRSVEDIMQEIEKRSFEKVEDTTGEVSINADLSDEEGLNNMSPEAMKDLIDIYKKYRSDDKALMAIVLDVEKLINTGKEYESDTLREKQLFFKIQDELDEYTQKIELGKQVVEKEARKKLCRNINGREIWPDDDDFQRNPDLYKIEGLMNRRKDSLLEKISMSDLLRRYLKNQSKGGLLIDKNDKDAVFINCTGRDTYIRNKRINIEIIPYSDYETSAKERDAYPLFPSIPHSNNIMQRKSLDSYFLSSLSILTEEHASDIKNLMVDNQDGTVTVRFYGKTVEGKYFPVYVTVDKVVSTEGGYIINGPEGCIWASCFERALAASGLFDCMNRKLPYALPVPKDIEDAYKRYKTMEERGELIGTALENAEKTYPWLFTIKDGNQQPRLMPWPRVDSILEGYVGGVFEAALGEDYNSVSVVIPKDNAFDYESDRYTDAEIKFYELVDNSYNYDIPVIACSSLKSGLIEEAHSYQVMGGKINSAKTRYILLGNPWGTSDGIRTSYFGLVPMTDRNGQKSSKWALVENGYFPMELKEFLREFDFVDVVGLNRFDIKYRGGLGQDRNNPDELKRMEEVFCELKGRLEKAMCTGEPQTPYVMSLEGAIDPSKELKEIYSLLKDESGDYIIEYAGEDGGIEKKDFKDVFFENAGFLLRDLRYEVVNGQLKPGEEETYESRANRNEGSVLGGDEYIALENEPLSFRVAVSYRRIIHDIEKVMACTKRFNETDSKEFKELLRMLQKSDNRLLNMGGKPFSELRQILFELEPYVENYEKYCSNHPEMSWRRSTRTAACKMIKNTISKSDSLLKKPGRNIYMKYAEFYASEMAKKKGVVLNTEYRQKVRDSLFNTPEFYDLMIKKNIFYLEYAQDKEFIEHLNLMMQ